MRFEHTTNGLQTQCSSHSVGELHYYRFISSELRDRIMQVLMQSIYTFNSRLTYSPAPDSYVLISSSKSSILLEFMKSRNLTFEIILY